MTPFTRSILDAVIPATARWMVAQMRRLEESNLDAASRWEFLKYTLTELSRERGR
jgi:hypothetical protein